MYSYVAMYVCAHFLIFNFWSMRACDFLARGWEYVCARYIIIGVRFFNDFIRNILVWAFPFHSPHYWVFGGAFSWFPVVPLLSSVRMLNDWRIRMPSISSSSITNGAIKNDRI